jgi:hypothetical protein
MLSNREPLFRFLPYKTLRDRFIELKDYLWDRYQGEQYAQIRDDVLNTAMRQLHMDALSDFDEQEKIIALTGILLFLQNQLHDYYHLHAQSSCYSVVHQFLHKQRLNLADLNEIDCKIHYCIGITPTNKLDHHARIAIKMVLKKLNEWEMGQLETPDPSDCSAEKRAYKN